MAVAGWIVDKSAAARAGEAGIAAQLAELAHRVAICEVGELEQLYSSKSAVDYDQLKVDLHDRFQVLISPPDLLTRALQLQRDLAHHHGMWHRIPIPDLLIAETALYHGFGVAHVDGDFDKIAKTRPLEVLRLNQQPM